MPQQDPFRQPNPFPNPLTGKMEQPPGPQMHGRDIFANRPTPGLSPGTRGPQEKPLNVPRIDQQRPATVAAPAPETWQDIRAKHIAEMRRIDAINKKIGGQGVGTPYPDYMNPGDPNPNDLFSERQRKEQQKLLADAEASERRRKASYLGPQGSVVHPVARYTQGWNMGKPVAGM